jgi:hypothetical protein
MSNIIKISGTIGIKILYNAKLNKKIFIFYDDHSNTKYCIHSKNKQKSKLFISDFLNKVSNEDIAMILEEPFMEPDSKIKILWDDSEHLFLFRKFYTKLINKCSKEKICKIFPFDIRLLIFDVSPDEIIFNLNKPHTEYNIKLKSYFENIFYLFDLNDIKPTQQTIIHFIKKVFDVYKKSKFYKFLKKRIINFSDKYKIMSSDKSIYDLIKEHHNKSNFIYEEGFPYINNHNDNFIDQLDKIASGIMEFYSLILILLLPNKNIVLYAGYYHSNNLSHILNKYYNFEEEYSSGITDDINTINESHIENCVNIEKSSLIFID